MARAHTDSSSNDRRHWRVPWPPNSRKVTGYSPLGLDEIGSLVSANTKVWTETQCRRMWFYTTHHNELLNVVCIHPDSLSQLPSNSNDAFGGLEQKEADNKANMLKIYEGFDPRVLALLELAEPSSVRLWQLLDMDPPPTRLAGGKLCLLGDAALPFLPYVGQGAASAIEDAASLAALLLPGISPPMIPERLQIYEVCRKERAEKLHSLSRTAGRDIAVENSEKDKVEKETEKVEKEIEKVGKETEKVEKEKEKIEEETEKVEKEKEKVEKEREKAEKEKEKARIVVERNVYAHDEYDHTTQKLREYLWRKEGLQWSMPTIFGPIPASRSNLHGANVDGPKYEYIRFCVKFRTLGSLLENLLPRAFLKLAVLGDFANASFVYTKHLNVGWLGGQSYSELAFYIHDVQCIKSGGSNLSGSFLAIVFVNSPDAVTDDREALGIPKVFCDLELTADVKDFEISSSYGLRASWQGFWFLEIQVQDLGPIKTSEDPPTGDDASDPIFTHRYIPALGNKGKPLADSIVCLPSILPQSSRTEVRMAAGSKADIKWNGSDEYTHPTLHRIIGRLSELAVLNVIEATVARGDGVPPRYEDAYEV